MGHEVVVRLVVFLGVFAVMALWELLAARRTLVASKGRRWLGNLSLVAVDTAVVRLIFPATIVGMALAAERFEWGLFHRLEWPYWLEIVSAVVLLDLAVYLQHVVFHAVPILFRLHMVHHADVDFDVTTGLRFHPIEILLSMIVKLSVVAILGPPVVAVVLFEVILNALAMFNHSNVRMPLGLDGVLRWFIVTPDMHRVHHSVYNKEYNRNFGFNLSCWDRLLGTYLPQPADGHEGMTIGLSVFRESKWRSLPRLLIMPFDRRAGLVGRGGVSRRSEDRAD